MTDSLLRRLKRLIATEGPMDVATYMRHCLTDPADGYYVKKPPFGRDGDFITAPEISQLFGEMIGIWALDIWRKLGAPAAFSLVEAGPGRGTLAADCLRTITKLAPDMMNAMTLRLVEISPALRERQKAALAPFETPLFFQETLDDLGRLPIILIANEFLDALPIRQYQFDGARWGERVVGCSRADELHWGLRSAIPEHLPGMQPYEGAVFEENATARHVVERIAEHISKIGGAALLIDYGHLESGFGDTFQAVRQHRFVDPLARPGEADLTAHVDFAALCGIAEKAQLAVRMTNQGAFLVSMGMLERAGKLGAGLSAAEQEKIQIDVERLAAPEKMGNLFKVMAITRRGTVPHGF
ncbi:MAG: SAM-dependent methyltransferase [Rhizobiales bacterium]|nr:SAM-dependent methyltransferase [Hyphomicrobiales bacterium]